MLTPFPNQPAPYGDRNLYLDDQALREAVARDGAQAFATELAAFGARLGTSEVLASAEVANRFAPELVSFDAGGERVDEVTFHPAWDALMALGKEAGEHSMPWAQPAPGAMVARAAKAFLHGQVENGTQCPLTMTFAGIPVLQSHADAVPDLTSLWLPRLLAREHDPRSLPVAQKRGALLGMGMTERQGGSDVRSNRTRAMAGAGDTFRITGHKWFFSAPQCDAHLLLAQEEAGLSCFFLPRFTPDGRRNAIRINRLKDKLGNRSNASSEVEFDEALAWRIGVPGKGVTTILEMVRYTRLDCVLGSAGIMRGALARALHHARQRVAFGRLLSEQALMQNVLADLALETEAATALALRLARAFESSADTERALARLVTPAAKFWVCKRGPTFAAEAMEVLGGNGYVESSALPRFYRELPVNSIWEGSGNVMCLDALRTMQREPAAIEALHAELAGARGMHAAFDDALRALEGSLTGELPESNARRVAQGIAVLMQASLLLRHAPSEVAAAFCASRLQPDRFGGAVFGTLPDARQASLVLQRALPE